MPEGARSARTRALGPASSPVHYDASRTGDTVPCKEVDSVPVHPPSTERPSAFVSCRSSFTRLLGPNPRLRLLLREPQGRPIFHEAGVYHPTSQSVWLSTNRMPVTADCATLHRQTAAIVRVDLSKIPNGVTSSSSEPIFQRVADLVDIYEELPAGLAMPSGATNWTVDGQESMLWCEQGRHNPVDSSFGGEDVHSALVAFTPGSLHDLSSASTSVLLDHYQGKRFSSLNDVVVHEQSGVVFFTDPDYGVGQNFKRPRLTDEEEEYAPNALYAWHPHTGEVRLLDDRYDQPNGITFIPSPISPASGSGLLCTTDTGAYTFTPDTPLGTFHLDTSRARCIYTYRVEPAENPERDPFPRIAIEERRLLGHSECGAPDGVHPDEEGNLWVGSGDGVHIYDPWSLADSDLSPLIGKIVLPTGKGVANFCWAGAVLTKQKGHAHSDGARVTERGASGEERGVGQQYRLLLFAEDELWEAHVGVNGRD